jgi:uncharacterized protein DUF4446
VEVRVDQLNNFVSSHQSVIGIVLLIGAVALVLMVAMLYIQSRRIAILAERLEGLTRGADGESLEAVLNQHLETVIRVAQELDEVQARTAMLESSARLHFSRLGLVRFNPFQDTGSNQSFALAMLDANNDGYVVSSLHSRTGTRIYAKVITGGKADTTLGDEEAQAVDIAASQGAGPGQSRTAAGFGRGAGNPAARAKATPGARTSGYKLSGRPIEETEDVEPAHEVEAEDVTPADKTEVETEAPKA